MGIKLKIILLSIGLGLILYLKFFVDLNEVVALRDSETAENTGTMP